MLALFHHLIRTLREIPAVTLAAVEGHCLGGGMELAAGCDLVLATENSRFGQPEIKLGCYPPLAAALYPNLLGFGRTVDLLVTGRTIDCSEAERIGFVTYRVKNIDLESKIRELIAELTAHSQAVTRITVQAIRAARSRDYDGALEESERLYLEELLNTNDMNEGIQSFLEKRSPVWKHR
jgi:cyclohexa-1,5-dienecarbonyl-CoA hydratase